MPKKSKKTEKPLYHQRAAPPGPGRDGRAAPSELTNPLDGLILHEDAPDTDSAHHQPSTLRPIYSSGGIWLYNNDCLTVMDAIAEKYPEGRFDCIFADPPYFLSNGGITCHAGKMVKVDKGDWDKSQGAEENHNFNREWLKRCQRVLKPNGTIWITGTHHVIFSVGFALQQLGFKILNDIAWEKPNPPPNLSRRYFTHSTETILWAAKNEKSKHLFNYQDMRKVTGKQMKTVWRKGEFEPQKHADERRLEMEGNTNTPSTWPSPPLGEKVSGGRMRGSSPSSNDERRARSDAPYLNPIWTMPAPGNAEKTHGKHPTQKPVALIERCLLASTNVGDLVLDPFMGGGTTAVVCTRLRRRFVGIEMDRPYVILAIDRTDAELIALWLRRFRVRIEIFVACRADIPVCRLRALSSAHTHSDSPPSLSAFCDPQSQFEKDLDLFSNLIDRSAPMADKPQSQSQPEPQTERIFHETKFVFLSCAQVDSASVVHTTVDVSLQEAWAKTPNGKRRETTHVVRCETEILRVKAG